jgi:hypothetical protein
VRGLQRQPYGAHPVRPRAHRVRDGELLGKPPKDATFESGGSWTSQPGEADPKATVYRLTEARSRENRFLLKASEGELRMLDRSGRPIESKLDYTLKRQPAPR